MNSPTWRAAYLLCMVALGAVVPLAWSYPDTLFQPLALVPIMLGLAFALLIDVAIEERL